ncbi:MAG: hypothetical protein H0X29_09205 [Parachlamydiaceae bacterium]|nr:hypothetical protein [Parachlamydiaceae bacterium]
MKKHLFLVLACLVGTVQAFASGCETDCCNPCSAPSDCCLDFDSKLYVSVGGGLRWDSISWKTSASGFNNGDFRQKWRDIKLGVIEADMAFLVNDHYLIKGDFDYGWVYGKSRLSTNTFGESSAFASSSSNFSTRSRNGHAYDLSGGIGYQFNFDCWSGSIAPLVGYSYNYLQLRRGSFDLYDSSVSDNLSSSSNANTHRFRLSGPWFGFGATYNVNCETLLYLDYAFHWTNFRAKLDEGLAFENTNTTFSRSYRKKNAYGNEVTLGGIYTLCDGFFAGLKFNYKNWYTSKGRNNSSPYNEGSGFGSSSNSSSSFSNSSGENSRFRHLDWNTYMVTVDIGYTF